MNIKSQKDFFSGLMFMGFGVAFAWGSSSYTIGSGARMGPGYFPLVLGVLLALCSWGLVWRLPGERRPTTWAQAHAWARVIFH